MDIDKALNEIVNNISPLQAGETKLPFGAKCYCESCTPFLFDPGIMLVPSNSDLDILQEELLVLLINIGWPLATRNGGMEDERVIYKMIRENLDRWVWGRFVCPHAAGEWQHNTKQECSENFKRVLAGRGIVCTHRPLVTQPNKIVQVQTKLSSRVTRMAIKDR